MGLGDNFTPASAAITLSHWLNAAARVGLERFPVDVEQLAKAVGSELKWTDHIVEVKAANIPRFEGGLFSPDPGRWALLYNEQITSSGRIRFTQAHELGHFLLHRTIQDSFECSQADVVRWGPGQKVLESQADEFASGLLLPIKQFRAATSGQPIDFEVLSAASTQFGVSLTAACLRWIRSTEESAVLVLSRDGFIDWSVSSDKAFKNGVYIKTRDVVVELPSGSLAADETRDSSRNGEHVALNTWFEHAHRDAVVREMKLICENYGYTLSLLHLSPWDKAWAPKDWAS